MFIFNRRFNNHKIYPRMFRNLTATILKFNFAKEVAKAGQTTHSGAGLTYYKDGQLTTRTHLVLKKTQDIEAYVIQTIQNYYRTTYKQGLQLESSLSDHGLDSLDNIEIAMQLEEDLGYVISAETLPSFSKVKHYVNYIEQVEAFKTANNKAPLP